MVHRALIGKQSKRKKTLNSKTWKRQWETTQLDFLKSQGKSSKGFREET